MGMYIKELILQNFRGIENIDFQFNDGINLLIGNNGAGKTSVLSAASNLLSILTYSISASSLMYIGQQDIRYVQKKISDTVVETEKKFPVSIEGNVDIDGVSLHYSQTANDFVQVLNHSQINGFQHKDAILTALDGEYPLISYQRFDHDWKLKANKNKGEITVRFGNVSRESGYIDCLSGNGYEEVIQKWCLMMALMEYERKMEIREFRLFQRIVELFLQHLEDNDQKISVYYSSEVGGLVYEDGSSRMPLYDLSTGYRSVLSMIMELAYRSVVLNPNMPDDFGTVKGIVLIDEIDAHLHPKWQWRILDALRATFPSVQFIVATHSPLIIASAKNVNIINLDAENGVSYLDSAYGFTAGDVLTLRQGTYEMPLEVKKQLDALENALDDSNDDLAKEILAKAKNEFGENSAFYNELYQTYKLNSWVDE